MKMSALSLLLLRATAIVMLAGVGWADDRNQPCVFDRVGAEFEVADAKVKYLRKGVELYSDKEFTMKERPKQLSSSFYIQGPFAGSTAKCTKTGVAFAIGLFDVHNQAQTGRVESYLKEQQWQEVKEVPEFALFYTNGADRSGKLFWKEIKKGETLTLPNGTILCSRQ